jgi:hypothetical protein
MSHKYHIRQLVRLVRPSLAENRTNPNSIYEVTRLLPADETGEFSYRVKSGSSERAVRESEITARTS